MKAILAALLLAAAAPPKSGPKPPSAYPTPRPTTAFKKTTIGAVELDAIPGWSRTADALVPPGVPAGSAAALTVKPAQPFTGDFRHWFEQSWGDFKDGQVGQESPVVESSANGVPTLRVDATLEGDGAPRRFVTFWAANRGGSAQVIVFSTDSESVRDAQKQSVDLLLSDAALK